MAGGSFFNATSALLSLRSRKLMSSEKLRALGWHPRIGLREGIAHAYRAFLQDWSGSRSVPHD
jgi:GDP-L-fucose synthase